METRSTRREVLLNISSGVALMAGMPVYSSQDPAAGSGTPQPAALIDYPKPPFPMQQQGWPGLTSKMSPRPDHGEHSYRGSGRLAGRRALVTGGDSGIG